MPPAAMTQMKIQQPEYPGMRNRARMIQPGSNWMVGVSEMTLFLDGYLWKPRDNIGERLEGEADSAESGGKNQGKQLEVGPPWQQSY
jgi:hypothetical protein